ncbi:AcrR family transcriptional regulator [Streptomyces sp. SAI-135]|jgi:AcrR family transcriptional regulator|uniref:TetR/AcrR family transcriptional regulator n=1 Tax=unclassified Streptomyces TaxID=2593676 RepID=UPI0024754AF1|nr:MULTISPECIES: TetR/AcrR family transcriptional regulator [unclassified Streptomyces]MDH6522856.1 AcrR family transcriptional regulator [Streptomyces sp. SAI-090]MDH6554476.1 AcrR family transcriptional regulator [Streptomyces sp. SAI-041]MDH6581526.1 AcrR family transcriptional regulator [Streptomyces sp. SAI-133]MDH6613529.1 AcrR family transcriptional regulator [Streptomyces sp. SAI-135]
MVSRAESAAATRRAVLDAAAELLDEGGPDAVTLRDVSARAGVSRGAPYGHFADKDTLLAAVATEDWERFSDEIAALRGTPAAKLRGALTALVSIGRHHPHRYRQMLGPPAGEDPGQMVAASCRAQEEFLTLVSQVVDEQDVHRYGGLLFTGVSGIINAELSGHFTTGKWRTSADALVDTLVTLIAHGQPSDHMAGGSSPAR